MVTPHAVTKQTTLWHSRATWSVRADRLAFVAWLVFLWIGILVGFGMDIPRFLHEVPPAPTVISYHGAVFAVWMLLLTTQITLVVRDRTALHRRLGWFLAGWACLMAVMGPWAAFASQTVLIHGPEYQPAFLSIQLGDILAFVVLLAWGVSLRKNPAAHKRIMILSTLAIVNVGFARISHHIWHPPGSIIVWYFWEFGAACILVALMGIYDWRRGHLMKQFVMGAGGLLVWQGITTFLFFWPPWKVFASGLVATWARHFG